MQLQKVGQINWLRTAVALVFSTFIMGVGINLFVKGYHLAPGGLAGFSLLVFNVTGFPLPLVMFCTSTVLIICAIRILGLRRAIKTLCGAVIYALMVQLTSPLSKIHFTNDVLLCVIIGSVMLGIGFGILLKSGGATGGTDLLALMFNRVFKKIKVTRFMMCFDGTIVVCSGIVNRSLETMLYSGIMVFIVLNVIDLVAKGFNSSRAFFIISEEPEKIKYAIKHELSRGLTVIDGKGGYENEDKKILFVAVAKNQELLLNQVVMSKDPNAFIIITHAKEVYGNGFKTFA